MSDNFFGFDTNFPSRNILGGKGLDEELLTDDVEEEYDALNDETFGRAANDDWEEAHEKLSELIIRKDVGKNSIFDDSLLETDESQNEIVSKSISQLGLEDDLDDPAIMTIARSCHRISHMRPYRSSSSPPPPAILETEFCGSPKTHSIWSTTPKDSGVSSIFQSLSHRSGSPCLDQSALLNTSSDSVFSTPPKAWHAEDLEKDLLSSSNKDHNTSIHNSSWPQAPHLNRNNNNQNVSPKLAGFSNNLGQNQNKIVMDQMLTREEVERQMHSESLLHFPPGVNTAPSPKLPWMGRMPPNLMPPMGPRGNLNSPNQSPVVPMRPPLGPLMRNGATERFFVNSRINNMMHNQMPVRGPVMPNLPPGFNPSNMNMNHKLMFLPPRSIAHPFLHKQFQFPMVVHNSYYGNEESRNAYQNSEDEYAGLMTQKEKDWLIRIQMLTLKSENPYVEDYYFTTQVARRCRKKYSEEKNSGNSKASGDAPDLILPETKHESRAFVPVQFEGSLGKLQAVSVNFPRKVLDVGVKRSLEDEEGKVVTNQSLMRYRRLLQDIEKLYNNFLEIEDEERRILAKPEGEGSSHRENIARLTKDIYTGLINESSEDYFQNLMTVRKGRSLYFRVFKLFSLDQQLQCLVSLLRCLHVVLKRDQNDLILVQNVRMILDAVQQLPFQHLVLLGETLENDASSDPVKGKEKSNLVAAFKSKFGTSVICTILMQAETLYPSLLQNESDLQSRWTKVILHLVDCLCSLPNSSIAPCEISSSKLLNHFERFAVDRDKFNLLKERVSQFQSNLPPKIEMKEV